LELPSASRPKLAHQSFALTIVATSSTGGGLKDYGVFRDQVVYTVYVDMDEPGHHRPRWTLQYGAVEKGGDPTSSTASSLPPYPLTKELPHLPEVASRFVGRMIVAKGVVNKKGELTALKVIQSPNPLLIEPVLDSLAKWTFQAAEFNGEPIEVRVLLGIPISADLIEDHSANTAK
jgi:hypothetical protein